jgi:chlorobactene glucosyltransferase
VSVMPRQLMLSFWERTVLPHIFAVINLRYFDLERVSRTRNPRHVIANGQFILMRREAYEATGGHEAVRLDVVEDQRLAQRIVESGRTLFVAHAHDLMDTRMYRSLPGIVEGWSKNLAQASRQASPRWAAPFVPWLIVLTLLAAWVVPPVILVVTVFTAFGSSAWTWSLAACALSLLFWAVVLLRMHVPLQYAAGYPLGALVTALLFVRSAVRGDRLQWKGRRYRPRTAVGGGSASSRPPPRP